MSRWLGNSITGRAVLATCLVALVSVLITAAIGLPLVQRSANEGDRAALAGKATVAANAIEGRDTPAARALADQRARLVVQTLREQGIVAVLILDGKPDQPGLPRRVVRDIRQGRVVSQRISYQHQSMLAEGRPAGPGDGIVLLQPVTAVTWAAVSRWFWLALAVGLLAGVGVGVLLARRLVRPLRQAAVTARRLSAGDRAARAPTDAPAEVAAVSAALNDLATALTASESRQRAFLTSVSHDLRTPLTTIRGYAEALTDGVITGDQARRAGTTMLAEAEHLDRLVEDLLALARLQADDFPLEIVHVDLGELATGAARAWQVRAGAVGVNLISEQPHHPVVVRTDPGRVRQVLDGLLENALRVVPAGAPVVLAAGDTPGFGVIEVRDGGPGLTDEDLAVAFDQGELHQRYKGVRKVGSGLGLALAARLVGRLGGRIEAGHASEGGARFTVWLPRA